MATNEPLSVYGGFRAPDSILEGLVAALRAGRLPFTFNHDALRPLRVTVADAGMETAADGSKRVWAEFDIDDEDLAYVNAEFDRHGVTGFMSWSMTCNPRRVGAVGEHDQILRVAADAGFFDSDQIAAAAEELATSVGVEVGEIYQFGAVPPALIVLEIQQQSDLWKDFLIGGTSSAAATLVISLLSKLLKPRHRYETVVPEPVSSIEIKLEEDGRVLDFHLRTNDPEVLKAAIEKLPAAAAERQPTLKFDERERLWLPPS